MATGFAYIDFDCSYIYTPNINTGITTSGNNPVITTNSIGWYSWDGYKLSETKIKNEEKSEEKGENKMPILEKVIYNNPATICQWSDGTKTVVKVSDGEEFNEEAGLCACIAKKFLGSRAKVLKTVKKAYRQPPKE